VSAARTANPSTVDRANPGSGCGAVTGATGTRPSASSSGTLVSPVRRAGRKPASACATVLVAKNSRGRAGIPPAAGAAGRSAPVAAPVPARQTGDAHHRPEGHLAQAADRGAPHDLLKLADLAVHVGGPAAPGEQPGQDLVRLGGADPARHALAARLVAEEPQHVRGGGEQVGALRQ